MKRHRIFIAINFPEKIKNELYSAGMKFEPLLNGHDAETRWVRKEGIHITLAFLGWLTDEMIADLVMALNEPWQPALEPFTIRFSKAVLAPSASSPKYVWVHIEANSALKNLWQALRIRLKEGNFFEKEDLHGFFPHLTIARISRASHIPAPASASVPIPMNLTADVTSFEIMESFVGRGGAQYMPLQSYTLSP